MLCDDVNHEKAIHVRTCAAQTLNLQVPPKKSRYPHLEHPLSHGRVDLKEIIQSSLQGLPKMIFVIHHFGPSNSGHFFLEPREKCSKDYINKHFGGEKLDIHQVFVGFSASGPQQEPFTSVFWHSNVPVIRPLGPPVCVSYTNCTG